MKYQQQRKLTLVTTFLLWMLLPVLAACGSLGSDSTGNISMRSNSSTPTTVVISDTSKTYANIELSEVPPALGIIVDQQWRVIDLEADGAAQKAGIQVGDALQRLGTLDIAALASQSPINSPDTLAKVHREIVAGKVIQIILQRKGQNVSINIQPTKRLGHPGQPTPTPVPTTQLYF